MTYFKRIRTNWCWIIIFSRSGRQLDLKAFETSASAGHSTLLCHIWWIGQQSGTCHCALVAANIHSHLCIQPLRRQPPALVIRDQEQRDAPCVHFGHAGLGLLPGVLQHLWVPPKYRWHGADELRCRPRRVGDHVCAGLVATRAISKSLSDLAVVRAGVSHLFCHGPTCIYW
jgi:hypothetical protein